MDVKEVVYAALRTAGCTIEERVGIAYVTTPDPDKRVWDFTIPDQNKRSFVQEKDRVRALVRVYDLPGQANPGPVHAEPGELGTVVHAEPGFWYASTAPVPPRASPTKRRRRWRVMGDIAEGHACDVFIYTFADDLVAKYRSKLLDETFGDRVRYYVMADEYHQVGLYAAVKAGENRSEAAEEHFRLHEMPPFSPSADDTVWAISKVLGLSEEEAEQRLKTGETAMAHEAREHNEQLMKEVLTWLEEEEEGD